MFARENEEVAHLRPACVECTHRCNQIHEDRDPEEEKFDPDRSWPYFGRKVTKLALHHSPQAALCIPGTFTEEYSNSVPKGKPITLEGPSGNKWRVGATDRSVFHLGWRAFAHDHRLREGDQLHFRLTKPSHFVVDIFNSHGEVRRSARKATVTGKYAPGTPPLQDQSRKRKVDMAELAGIGKGIMSNIVDRWQTPARRGIGLNEPPATVGGARLRFSEKTKQWESHEAKDRLIITIDLDSDDEEPPARSSKLERLIEHMEEEEDFISPKSKAIATQVDAKSHRDIPGDDKDDIVAHENDFFDDEKQKHGDDPLRQFTTIFDTAPIETLEGLQETTGVTVEKAVFKAKKEKIVESAYDPLSREAQILCDEDIVMVKEEAGEQTYRIELENITPQASCVVVEKNLETIIAEQDIPKEEKHEDLGADKATKTTTFHEISDNHTNAVLQSKKAAAAEYESVTNNAVDTSQVTKVTTITAISEMYESEFGTVKSMAEDVRGSWPQMQEAESGFSFGLAMDNVVDFPVINTINGGQTDTVHPLKQRLKQADDLDTPIQKEDELHLTESKSSQHEDRILSASNAHELHVSKTEPGMEPEEILNMPILYENTQEKETVLPFTHGNISNPESTIPDEKENTNNDIHASVARMSQSYSNTFVLGSKRGPVFQVDREKALKAAQAWARKIRNPNFVAVMKRSHVYTDFNMDIPAEFGKQSKLPAKDVRVTLVCDEVPTNCKAIWMGSKAKIDSKGWVNFSRSHRLEEGDVCVFECCTTTASIRLGVYIFRVVKLQKPILLDWTRHYKVLECTNAAAGFQTNYTTNQAYQRNAEAN